MTKKKYDNEYQDPDPNNESDAYGNKIFIWGVIILSISVILLAVFYK